MRELRERAKRVGRRNAKTIYSWWRQFQAGRYMQDTIAILERTPGTLNALLRGLPEPCTQTNEGENTWSARDVVGHLIDGEREDWIPRARIILQHGESQPFTSFDRWRGVRDSQGKSLDLLLDEFARLRSESLSQLRALNLQGEDFQKRGRHPALGVVSVSELLATWVVHDLSHLHQISRVLAHQYRDCVGPWREYLGVLRCKGHSS